MSRWRRTSRPFPSSYYEKCSICGYLRINVRHEQDPDNAPEGPDYYADMKRDGLLHKFAPSGRYER